MAASTTKSLRCRWRAGSFQTEYAAALATKAPSMLGRRTVPTVPRTCTVTGSERVIACCALGVCNVVPPLTPRLEAAAPPDALDSIARGLHAPVSTAQWTISAYVLAMGMVEPVSGWASDRFGAKQTWMAALGVFMVGSVLASVAWSIGSLIAFRVLQGAGGGIMLPLLMNLMVQGSGGRPLGKVMATVSLPVLVGPVLGGIIVSQLSWRFIFWVNVPFSLLGLVLAWRGLERTTPHKGAYLDVVGLALLAPALAAII